MLKDNNRSVEDPRVHKEKRSGRKGKAGSGGRAYIVGVGSGQGRKKD